MMKLEISSVFKSCSFVTTFFILNVYLHAFDLCCQGSPVPSSLSVDSDGSKDADDFKVTIFKNDCKVLELIVDQAERLSKERTDYRCPSTIKFVNDSDRLPKTLLQRECINPRQIYEGKTYLCEDIAHEVPVLRNFQGQGWMWSLDTINVGCRAVLSSDQWFSNNIF